MQGVPIREGLQDMYTIFRDKAYKEFIIFLVFYVIFIAVTISQHTFDTAFQTDMALIDRFIDEEFPDASYKKNFEEIMTMGEFWEWVQGPFFEGVYENKWYNDRPFNEFEKGMLLNYFRVAGPIQFRQNRVSNSSCRTRRFLTFGKERSCADGPWNLCQVGLLMDCYPMCLFDPPCAMHGSMMNLAVPMAPAETQIKRFGLGAMTPR